MKNMFSTTIFFLLCSTLIPWIALIFFSKKKKKKNRLHNRLGSPPKTFYVVVLIGFFKKRKLIFFLDLFFALDADVDPEFTQFDLGPALLLLEQMNGSTSDDAVDGAGLGMHGDAGSGQHAGS